MSMKAFCITHWGIGGQGTGKSIVVASSARIALAMLEQYFQTKADGEGFRQYTAMRLLEVEDYEESLFASYPISTEEAGVVLEYWLAPEEEHVEQLIFMAADSDILARELWDLQAQENNGRGITCVRAISDELKRKEYSRARAIANNDSDKLRNYPKVVAVLKRVGFWYELDLA